MNSVKQTIRNRYRVHLLTRALIVCCVLKMSILLRKSCKVKVCTSNPCPSGNGYCVTHLRTIHTTDCLSPIKCQTISLQKYRATEKKREYWREAKRKSRLRNND